MRRQVHETIAACFYITDVAVELDADNQTAHLPGTDTPAWRSIRSAVMLAEASGTTWCGEVDPRWIVLDDDRGDRRKLVTANQLLRDCGYPVLTTLTGQPGHGHHIIPRDAIPRHERSSLYNLVKILGLDVRERLALARSPLAPSRLGLPVGTLGDWPLIDIIDFLTPPAPDDPDPYRRFRRLDIQHQRSTHTPRRVTVTADTATILDAGFTPDGDASEEFWALLCHLARTRPELGEDDVYDLIEDSAIAGYCTVGRPDAPPRARKHRAGRRWFHRRWVTARTAAHNHTRRLNSGTATDKLDPNQATTDFYSWLQHLDTRTAVGARTANLLAALYRRGDLTVRLSVRHRDLAWIADPTHISEAFRHAVSVGALTLEGGTAKDRDDWWAPNTYRLQSPPAKPRAGDPAAAKGAFRPCAQNLRQIHDTWLSPVFTWGAGLGRTAARARTVLLEHPVRVWSTGDLASELGVSRDTARKAVKALAEHGLCRWEARVGAQAVEENEIPEPNERHQARVHRRRVRAVCERARFRRRVLFITRANRRRRRKTGSASHTLTEESRTA